MERPGGEGTSRPLGISAGASSSGPVKCQVDGCGVELGDKIYYRRHRVCEDHAKASRALVGGVDQRFCQQCSRFHALSEFDNERRSCRSRLLGHNKRRRKELAESASISGVQETSSDRGRSGKLHQAPTAGPFPGLSDTYASIALGAGAGGRPAPGEAAGSSEGDAGLPTLSEHLPRHPRDSPQAPQKLPNEATRAAAPPSGNPFVSPLPSFRGQGPALSPQELACLLPQRSPPRHAGGGAADSSSRPSGGASPGPERRGGAPGPSELLRQVAEIQDMARRTGAWPLSIPPGRATSGSPGIGDLARSPQAPRPWFLPGAPQEVDRPGGEEVSPDPQTTLSLGSTPPVGGDEAAGLLYPVDTAASNPEHERTSRLTFKLFERSPADLPPDLRLQILEWLEQRPSAMEAYIRPGCVILTIHIRMPAQAWAETGNFAISLGKLLKGRGSKLWLQGNVAIQLERKSVVLRNGTIVEMSKLDEPSFPNIRSVRPLCIAPGAPVHLSITTMQPLLDDTRIICSYNNRSRPVSIISSSAASCPFAGHTFDRSNSGRGCTQSVGLLQCPAASCRCTTAPAGELSDQSGVTREEVSAGMLGCRAASCHHPGSEQVNTWLHSDPESGCHTFDLNMAYSHMSEEGWGEIGGTTSQQERASDRPAVALALACSFAPCVAGPADCICEQLHHSLLRTGSATASSVLSDGPLARQLSGGGDVAPIWNSRTRAPADQGNTGNPPSVQRQRPACTSVVLDGRAWAGQQGRAFLELEPPGACCAAGGAWPLLIADEATAAEICSLENELDVWAEPPVEGGGGSCRRGRHVARDESVLQFLHDFGWALQELQRLTEDAVGRHLPSCYGAEPPEGPSAPGLISLGSGCLPGGGALGTRLTSFCGNTTASQDRPLGGSVEHNQADNGEESLISFMEGTNGSASDRSIGAGHLALCGGVINVSGGGAKRLRGPPANQEQGALEQQVAAWAFCTGSPSGSVSGRPAGGPAANRVLPDGALCDLLAFAAARKWPATTALLLDIRARMIAQGGASGGP